MGADDSRGKVRAPPDESLKRVSTALSASPWVAHSTDMTYYSLQFELVIDHMSLRSLLLVSIFAFTSTFASSALALGTVAGQFTDARSGAPVPGVLVELGTVIFGGFVPTGQQVSSDAQGRYSMNILAGQTYVLRVTPAAPLLSGYWPETLCPTGTICSFPGFGNVSVQEGGFFTADMRLTTPGSLAGRVTRDFDGAPIPGLTIHLRRTEQMGLLAVQVPTDALGSYLVDGLPPGTYRVYTEDNPSYQSEIYDNIPCPSNCASGTPGETLVPVVADEIANRIDIALARAGEITGRIRDAGSSVLQVGTGLRLERLVNGSWVIQDALAVSAGSGSYTFTSLPPGSYTLSTYNSGSLAHNNVVYAGIDCAADDCTATERAAGTLISLLPGRSTTLNLIELQPAASIRACVRDAQTSMPLPGVHIVAYSPTPAPIVGYVDYNSATSAADGCALIDFLRAAPDGLRLRTANGSGYLDGVYGGPACLGNQCELGGGALVPLAHDQNLQGIDFALTRGASIAGTLLARTGGPGVRNAWIELVDTASGFSVRYEDLERLRTPATGRFRSFALPDGSYTLKARVSNETNLTRTYTYSGGPVTISQGISVEDIVFVLEGETVHYSGFESP